MRMLMILGVIFLSTKCQGQTLKIPNKSNFDLKLVVDMQESRYSLGDAQKSNIPFLLKIINQSDNSIKIQPQIDRISGYGIGTHLAWDVGDIYYSYGIAYYDSVKKNWLTLDNSRIYNSKDRVSPISDKELIIKPNEDYTQKMDIAEDIWFSQPGKYKVQIFIGVKIREDASMIFSSNIIELNLIR